MKQATYHEMEAEVNRLRTVLKDATKEAEAEILWLRAENERLREVEGSQTLDERVRKFFAEAGIGAGGDPIGFLLASHKYLSMERNHAVNANKLLTAEVTRLRNKLEEMINDKQ